MYFLLPLFLFSPYAFSGDFTGKLGTEHKQVSENSSSQTFSSFLYSDFEFSKKINETHQLQADFRLKKNLHDQKDETVLIRELYFQERFEKVRASVGALKASYSESFGLNITNIPNGINWSEGFFLASSERELPFWGAKLELTLPENMSIDLLFAPIAADVQLPFPTSPFNPLPENLQSFSVLKASNSESEGGLYAKKLLDSGIDLGVGYYSHLSRTPVFLVNYARRSIEQIREREDSYLATFSYAFNNFVWRGDASYSPSRLKNDGQLLPYYQKELLAILGTDYFWGNSFNTGIQLHVASDTEVSNTWGAFQLHKTFFDSKVELTYIYFQGINNRDNWNKIESILQLADNWQTKIEVDFVGKNSNESLEYYKGLTLAAINLQYLF